MALGLLVRITDTDDNRTHERTIDRFPVRIGRNSLNDLELSYGFVSQFHALIDLNGQSLMLIDLGSKNGIQLRNSGTIPPKQWVDLGAYNYEFAIRNLYIQVRCVNVPDATNPKKRHGTVLGLNVTAAADGTLMMDAALAKGAANAKASAASASLRTLYDAYRSSWAELFKAFELSLASMDPAARKLALEGLASAFPGATHEPEFKQIAGMASDSSLPPESVALQGLKELAAGYSVSGKGPETPSELISFLQRVQDVLDVFFRCFVPLRDGQKQFESSMAGLSSRNRRMHEAAESVLNARTPRELGARLLDWTDTSIEGPRALEGAFADFMIHQVAMLNGIMQGVKSLLTELSPSILEKALEKTTKNIGWTFGPYRFRALWALFRERHADLATEDRETYSLVFGPEFAQAYNQLAEEAGARVGAAAGTSPNS